MRCRILLIQPVMTNAGPVFVVCINAKKLEHAAFANDKLSPVRKQKPVRVLGQSCFCFVIGAVPEIQKRGGPAWKQTRRVELRLIRARRKLARVLL